jgi:hypothetical protein
MTTPRFSQPDAPGLGAQPQCDPADACQSWEWIGEMAKIGFTIVVVEMRFEPDKLQQFGPPEVLAAQLVTEKEGHFDSAQKGNPFNLFFNVFTEELPTTLQSVKSRLEHLGLLGMAKIGHAECADKVWRTFFPALAGTAEIES